ncbi:MAG: phospho-sugar mutase [Paludibacter sp.]|nr:phospho-sugar mutase [Bacteroidales bacterium]MCM1069747.1 phospho-sugar mutase [Prevotella sp.]MCM1354432.1 phospho-sugar mutase [Bacteroides sp.]MCM1443230.1 phospho-sugar mutase [Muribaculum sp.]MCM1482466.1 phospho-sugar mutase [Paludibacter sp.]
MMNEELKQVMQKAETWLSGNYDAETQAQVRAMLEAEDKTELIESFYKDLEFGTGGLRGIMGAGSNRMNIYTVGAATQGLANYINLHFAGKNPAVVVGHDCRNNSRKFAEIAADIFSANGIKAYLFEDLRPTPEISFAIRQLGCQSGVIVTASHNPKEYNGYKVYWEDGAQIIAPHDTGIINEVNKVTVDDIRFTGNPALIEIIGKEMDRKFMDAIKTLSLSPEAVAKHKDMKIVYTPCHGTGVTIIPQLMKELGFDNFTTVEEQCVIDGNFPTVKSPNPEEPATLSMAIEKAKRINADMVCASDPDADRLGIAVKNDKDEWVLINGNQTCIMFTYYILRRRQELGLQKDTDFVVKTIVTSEVMKDVADKYGVTIFDCYTGFKWIAGVVRELEGKRKYVGGGEESFGYMAEDFCRDKDSVSAIFLMSEMAAWAKEQGKSLYQLLQDIYIEVGYGKEKGISVVRPGKTGAEEIRQMMVGYRENPPKEIAGSPVVRIKDYQTLENKNLNDNTITTLDFPAKSNVLQFFTADGTKISVRPSGTEPKIKFYIEVRGELTDRNGFDAAEATAQTKIDAVRASLGI